LSAHKTVQIVRISGTFRHSFFACLLSFVRPGRWHHQWSVHPYLTGMGGMPRLGVGMFSAANRACPPKPVGMAPDISGGRTTSLTVREAAASARLRNAAQAAVEATQAILPQQKPEACVQGEVPQKWPIMSEQRARQAGRICRQFLDRANGVEWA
jgi:hypothetical protein